MSAAKEWYVVLLEKGQPTSVWGLGWRPLGAWKSAKCWRRKPLAKEAARRVRRISLTRQIRTMSFTDLKPWLVGAVVQEYIEVPLFSSLTFPKINATWPTLNLGNICSIQPIKK